MKLIFSIAACMMQCFGFVLKVVLVKHQCFHCCWTVLTQHWAGWGGWGARVRERTEADPSSPEGYPTCHDGILSHKSSRKGGTFMVIVFVFHYMCWGPALQGVAGHLSAHGKWWESSLFCLVCTCSSSPLKLSLSWFMSHLASFLFSSVFHERGEWRSSCVDAWLLPGSMLHTYIVYLLPCK